MANTRDTARQPEPSKVDINNNNNDVAAPGDCLSCRVVGTATCLGLSGYLMLQMYAKPPKSPIQQRLVLFVSGGFAALGVLRAIT